MLVNSTSLIKRGENESNWLSPEEVSCSRTYHRNTPPPKSQNHKVILVLAQVFRVLFKGASFWRKNTYTALNSVRRAAENLREINRERERKRERERESERTALNSARRGVEYLSQVAWNMMSRAWASSYST